MDSFRPGFCPVPGGITTEVRTDRPLRRRFVRYSICAGDNGLELVDNFEEFDPTNGEYIRKEERFPLLLDWPTEAISTRLPEIELLCSIMRREIDAAGLKIFFDPAPNGERRPKWRYRVGSRTITDYITVVADGQEAADPRNGNPDSMPLRILLLAQRNFSYHQTLEWRNWFGRKMQRKREEIILRELRERWVVKS